MLLPSISRQKLFCHLDRVTSTCFIASVIGITEMLFEFLITMKETALIGTRAKAHLYARLMELLRGCKGLNIYRLSLMNRVIAMSDLGFRSPLNDLEKLKQPSFYSSHHW